MESAKGRFNWRGKVLFLRHFHLHHIPSAQYGAQILTENQIPVVVLEYGNIEKGAKITAHSLPIVRLEGRWAKFVPKLLRPAMQLLVTLSHLIINFALFQRPKLVVSHGMQEQWLAWVLHQIFRVPYVTHVHEVFERAELKNLNQALFQMEGNALRGAKFTVFPELQRADIYRKCYRLTEPLIAYNCPRLRSKGPVINLREKLDLPADAVIMGYIGGMGDTNALEDAIRAVAAVKNVYFVLIGWIEDNYRKKLEMVCYENHVLDRVRFILWVPDRWPWFDNIDISYCIYRSNTLRLRHLATASNKLTESMASGVPVITSGNEDFRKVVERYRVGVCAKHITTASITEALAQLAENAQLRKELGANGLKAHAEIFNYEKQFEPVLRAYRELLSTKEVPTSNEWERHQPTFKRAKSRE